MTSFLRTAGQLAVSKCLCERIPSVTVLRRSRRQGEDRRRSCARGNEAMMI